MGEKNRIYKYSPEVRAYLAQAKRDYRARVKNKVSAAAHEAHSANLAQTPEKPIKVLEEARAA